MNLVENINALRAIACVTEQPHLKDVQFLAKRAAEDSENFLDKDSWGQWDSWNNWGAAS